MSDMKYEAPLDIFIHYPVNGSSDTKIELLHYDVDSFEVDGGAVRKINLTSTEEKVIDNELEDARTFKNITFYLKSSRRASTSKLIDLAKSGVATFTTNLLVKVYKKSERKLLRVCNLIAKSSFIESPIPVGGTPPSMKIRLSLDNIELYRGVYNNGQLGEFVNK